MSRHLVILYLQNSTGWREGRKGYPCLTCYKVIKSNVCDHWGNSTLSQWCLEVHRAGGYFRCSLLQWSALTSHLCQRYRLHSLQNLAEPCLSRACLHMADFLSLRSADSCCSIPRVCTSCCFSYVSTLAFFALQLVNTCMIPVTLQSPFPPFRHIMHTSLSHLLSLIGLDLYSFRLRVVPVGLLNNLDPESSMSYFIFASTFQIGPWSGRHEDDRIVATSLIPRFSSSLFLLYSLCSSPLPWSIHWRFTVGISHLDVPVCI